MKAILHFGIHKTGSTSIQRSLRAKNPDGFNYLRWNSFSHSTLFRLLFEDDASMAMNAKVAGHTNANVVANRALWSERCRESMRERPDDTVIFSAERASVAPRVALEACRDFFAPTCDDIQVVMYLRPPVSFIQSVFQQSVKDGNTKYALEKLWPNYRKRIRRAEKVFGRDAVTLRVFRRADLLGGDVVLDFCDFAGIEISSDEVISANEGLSAEALALLFVQRRFGAGQASGFAGAVDQNRTLFRSVVPIGNSKMGFGAEAVMPILEANAEELAWTEKRLGRPLADAPSDRVDYVINGPDDLIALALKTAQSDEGQRKLGIAVKDATTPEALARHLDTIQRTPRQVV